MKNFRSCGDQPVLFTHDWQSLALKVVEDWSAFHWPEPERGLWVQVKLQGSSRQWGPEMARAWQVATYGCRKGLLIIGPTSIQPEGLGFFQQNPRLWSQTLWVVSSSDEQSWEILQWALKYQAFDWIWIWRQGSHWKASAGRRLFYQLRPFGGQLWEWACEWHDLTPSPLVHVSLVVEPVPHKIWVLKWKIPSKTMDHSLTCSNHGLRELHRRS